jgi:hypothetical protein
VAFIDQLLSLPYAVIWLPGLVFFGIVGSIFWLMRRESRLAMASVVHAEDAVKPLVAVSPAEQRVAFRRQGNPVQIHVGNPNDKNHPEPGCVLDRSVGGMRLTLYNEVEPGVVLSIRPVHADNIVPWVDVEVRSCRISADMTGQFEVGCKYVRSPPYSIQLLFG